MTRNDGANAAPDRDYLGVGLRALATPLIGLQPRSASAEAAMVRSGNILANLPAHLDEEEIAILAELRGARIERIVSTGQASPAGFWYDQNQTEWVILLAGSGGVLFEGEDAPRILAPGDYLEIPPHVRHRVDWTDAGRPTVWLAVHAAACLSD